MWSLEIPQHNSGMKMSLLDKLIHWGAGGLGREEQGKR